MLNSTPLRQRADSSFPEGISVVMPCLNEAKTLGRCCAIASAALSRIGYPSEIIVADNGSTDGSAQIARDAGAIVVPVATRGYGAALNGGISAARFRWVIFADADLSYPFEAIASLVQPLREDQADFVLGTRLGGQIEAGAMPPLNRYLGTPVLSRILRLFFGLPTTDCNSGMRAMKRSAYESLGLICPGMEYASEMLIRAKAIGLRYREVPIPYRKDGRGHQPHLRPWRDGWRHLRFILANTSSKLAVLLPAAFSLGFLALAFYLSLEATLFPNRPARYHTALISIALAVPPLLIGLSVLLIKIAVPSSCQAGEKRLIDWVKRMGERNVPILASLAFLALIPLEIGLVVWHWERIHWAALNEMGAVIRIMLFTVLATVFFVLDIGLAILGLVARPTLESPGLTPETQATYSVG